MDKGIEKWRFKTERFAVVFSEEPEWNCDWSWDEDGSARKGVENGEFDLFCAKVAVLLDGREIAADYLGECIYRRDEFHTAHRDPDPMNRNCSLMRAARGDNVVICHYFPGMVSQAIKEARDYIKQRPQPPRMRETA